MVAQNAMVTLTGRPSPWNEAVYFKIKQISNDYMGRRFQDVEALMTNKIQKITDDATLEIQAMDRKFEPEYKACTGVGGDCLTKVAYRHCKERLSQENRYHNALADIAENFQNKWFPQDLDFYNKMIWLMSLRSTDDQFLQAESATQTINLLHQLKAYALSVCNPGGKPDCEQYNPANAQNPNSPDFKDAQCPIKFKIPFGAGKVIVSCQTFGIEVGQGVKFGFEKNFITKESTISMGAGVDADIPGILDAKVKEKLFIKFDKNNQAVDMGLSSEASIGIKGMPPIASIGYTMAVNSGVSFHHKSLF